VVVVGAVLTTCETLAEGPELDHLLVFDDAYVAVIEWVPTASVDTAIWAWPLLSELSLPRVVEPSLKVTVPCGVPGVGDAHAVLHVTLAVRVTVAPAVLGFGLGADMVVVVAHDDVHVARSTASWNPDADSCLGA
jgi:hypothetical protein